MSYDIDLRPGLVDEIMVLPLSVQQTLQAALRRLADDPSLARPSTLPAYPPGRMYVFDHVEADGSQQRYAVLFKFTADEQKLWISHIVPV
jgi:hypothetical protein